MNTKQILADGPKGLDCIKEFTKKLPEIHLPMMHSDLEYPIIDAGAFGMVGVDYHSGREVFAIGGCLFFKRYSGDNCMIMCSTRGSFDHAVAWDYNCPRTFLPAISKLVDEKGYDKITKEDVLELLKFD